VNNLGWEDVEARQNFGLYQRIMLLDAGVQPYSDEDVLELFDFTSVPIEVVPVDLTQLRGLLRDNLRPRTYGPDDMDTLEGMGNEG
jgi:hypothetical protein